MIFRGLLDKFKSGTLPLMQKELQKSLNQVGNIKDKICKTMISITYLRKGYLHRTGAWELVVTKAETWISSIVRSHSVVQELERTAAANWIGTEIYDDEQPDPERGVSLGVPNSGCYPSSVPKHNSSASPNSLGVSSMSNSGTHPSYFDPTQGYSMGDPHGYQPSSSYPPAAPLLLPGTTRAQDFPIAGHGAQANLYQPYAVPMPNSVPRSTYSSRPATYSSEPGPYSSEPATATGSWQLSIYSSQPATRSLQPAPSGLTPNVKASA